MSIILRNAPKQQGYYTIPDLPVFRLRCTLPMTAEVGYIHNSKVNNVFSSSYVPGIDNNIEISFIDVLQTLFSSEEPKFHLGYITQSNFLKEIYVLFKDDDGQIERTFNILNINATTSSTDIANVISKRFLTLQPDVKEVTVDSPEFLTYFYIGNVKKLIEQLPAKLDILVLNASTQAYTYIEQFDPAEFDREMAVNVRSSFQLLEAVLPGMKERKYGRIIAISSINQTNPAARLSVYSATKSALANLMRIAAKEYAQYGITANTILPGVIVTDRNRKALENREFADRLKADIPAHRFGDAEECAALAAFLGGEDAGYITGAEIPISGGWQL